MGSSPLHGWTQQKYDFVSASLYYIFFHSHVLTIYFPKWISAGVSWCKIGVADKKIKDEKKDKKKYTYLSRDNMHKCP